MKKFLYLILVLVLSLFGVTFTIQNPQDILVQYYMGIAWTGPLAIIVLVSLISGVIVGLLIGLAKNVGLRRKYSKLMKEKTKIDREHDSSAVIEEAKTNP